MGYNATSPSVGWNSPPVLQAPATDKGATLAAAVAAARLDTASDASLADRLPSQDLRDLLAATVNAAVPGAENLQVTWTPCLLTPTRLPSADNMQLPCTPCELTVLFGPCHDQGIARSCLDLFCVHGRLNPTAMALLDTAEVFI